MQFSVGSCSPGNSGGSSEFMFPFLDYEDYVQYLVGDDPYAPGFAPDSPAPAYAPAPFCVYIFCSHDSSKMASKVGCCPNS